MDFFKVSGNILQNNKKDIELIISEKTAKSEEINLRKFYLLNRKKISISFHGAVMLPKKIRNACNMTSIPKPIPEFTKIDFQDAS